MTTAITTKTENTSLFSNVTLALCVAGLAEAVARIGLEYFDPQRTVPNFGGIFFYGAAARYPELRGLGAAVFTGYAVRNATHKDVYLLSKYLGLGARAVAAKAQELLPKEVVTPHHPSWLGFAALGALRAVRYLRG